MVRGNREYRAGEAQENKVCLENGRWLTLVKMTCLVRMLVPGAGAERDVGLAMQKA